MNDCHHQFFIACRRQGNETNTRLLFLEAFHENLSDKNIHNPLNLVIVLSFGKFANE